MKFFRNSMKILGLTLSLVGAANAISIVDVVGRTVDVDNKKNIKLV